MTVSSSSAAKYSTSDWKARSDSRIQGEILFGAGAVFYIGQMHRRPEVVIFQRIAAVVLHGYVEYKDAFIRIFPFILIDDLLKRRAVADVLPDILRIAKRVLKISIIEFQQIDRRCSGSSRLRKRGGWQWSGSPVLSVWRSGSEVHRLYTAGMGRCPQGETPWCCRLEIQTPCWRCCRPLRRQRGSR